MSNQDDKIQDNTKYHYDVVVEAQVPTKIKFQVWAKNELEAIQLVESGKAPPVFIEKPKILPKYFKDFFLYVAGSVLLLRRKRKL
jgi:hypothetical protein